MSVLKVVKHFDTIQGEGYYAGEPVHLIRLHGCNLNCEWCDSKFALTGPYTEIAPEALAKELVGHHSYLWTGGEPMLQAEQISLVIESMPAPYTNWHAIETNGTILNEFLHVFDWVEFSPKNLDTLIKCKEYAEEYLEVLAWEIKVVTDLESIGVDMIQHEACECLMPLTTGVPRIDVRIKSRVWRYCVKNRKRYSGRLQQGVAE